MSDVEISVCIPVYKVEKYIAQCLKSILSQTFIDRAEIILVNDCTPDNSIAVAERVIRDFPSVEERCRIINHKENRGLAAARNTGLDNANGKYVVCIDSDDWIEPTYLEELLSTAEKYNADITGCDYFQEDESRQQIIKENLSLSSEDCLKHILTVCQGIIWTKLIKKSLFTENHIQWEEGLDMGEDLLICTKLFSVARRTACTGTPLYHYRLTNENSMCNDYNNIEKKNAQLILVTNRISELLSPIGGYKLEINLMKLGIKKIVIFTTKDKSSRRKFYSLFPESKPYLTRSALSRKEKIMIFLINNGFYVFADLLFLLRGI